GLFGNRRFDMNFELTNEQVMIKQMVKEFAQEVIQPRAITIDKNAEFPVAIFEQMAELGLLVIPFPEKYGVCGGDKCSYIRAVEEIGNDYYSTGLSYPADVSLGACPIYYFGTEKQNEHILTPLSRSEALGTFRLT